MKVPARNEADVREEVAVPFLAALGYGIGGDAGTEILREYSLKYDRAFLGRKKDSDPPLRGRADYILVVRGAARWTLEIKAPSEPIDRAAIEQAMSYARHPEVAGTYAAVLNGTQFVVLHASQPSDEAPIVDLPVSTGVELAKAVEGLLAPAAVRRDCSPPVVDLAKPIAPGFRSTATILRGYIDYEQYQWKSNLPLQPQAHRPLDEMAERLTGMRSNIVGGRVWRDESSRIVAKLQWTAPHPLLVQFSNDKGLMDFEYVCLDEQVSSDPAAPSVFDVFGSVEVQKGERLFDIIRWQSTEAGITTKQTVRGQAVGHILGNVFSGRFQSEQECTFTSLPLELTMYGTGSFQIEIDPR